MVYKKPYVERGVAVAEITAITPQKKDRTRCNIEVDGRFYCGMKLETVMKNRLKAGQTVCADELSRMQLESEKTTAFDKALTHITATAKTEREVRLFLQKKGYLGDVCDYVVDKMKEYGFLDDGELCKERLQGQGAAAHRVKVKAKGSFGRGDGGGARLSGKRIGEREEGAGKISARKGARRQNAAKGVRASAVQRIRLRYGESRAFGAAR